MTNQDFNFDPLPGDLPAQPAARPPADKPAGKKRGRKPKPDKLERKKRAREITGVTITGTAYGPAAVEVTTAPIKRLKPEVTPYHLIKQLMVLPETQRRQILEALNEVFG